MRFTGCKILALGAVMGLSVVCGVVFARSVNLGFEDAGGALPYDVLGRENLIVNGDPVWVQGQVGAALKLDGDGDYLELGRIAGLTSEQTKMLWLCVDVLSTEHDVYVIDEGGGGNNNWIELIDSDKDGISHVRAGFDGENYIDSKAEIRPGYWNHIAVASRSSGELAIYINGKHDTSTHGLSAEKQPEEIVIGTDSGSKEASFAGIIDEVSIHTRPLAAWEIEQLYKQGLVGQVYTINPVADAVENIRSAIAAKQQALSSIDEALHRELALNKDLQIILESRRQGNSQELVGLMGAMENTRTSISRLQESREALRQSLEALTKASAELDSYYTRQDTNTPRNPQPPIAPPRVYDSSARGGSSVEGISAAELAER